MELQQQIERELKEAIRAKDEIKRDAVRSLLTVMKNKEKELRRPPNEMEIQQLIATQIKQRRDAAEQYLRGGRQELAQKEENEVLVLQGFLPESLSPEALEALVVDVIAEVGARSSKDMGKVMKALMPKIAGRAEGKQVNELVRRKLSQ